MSALLIVETAERGRKIAAEEINLLGGIKGDFEYPPCTPVN